MAAASLCIARCAAVAGGHGAAVLGCLSGPKLSCGAGGTDTQAYQQQAHAPRRELQRMPLPACVEACARTQLLLRFWSCWHGSCSPRFGVRAGGGTHSREQPGRQA